MYKVYIRRGVVAFRGITHAAITAAVIWTIGQNKTEELWWMMAGGIIGSYLPDADINTSPAGRIIPVWIYTRHRTHMHSLFAAACTSSAAFLASFGFGLGIALGYMLHLAGDKFTYSGKKYGLPYLFWVPGRKIKTPPGFK